MRGNAYQVGIVEDQVDAVLGVDGRRRDGLREVEVPEGEEQRVDGDEVAFVREQPESPEGQRVDVDGVALDDVYGNAGILVEERNLAGSFEYDDVPVEREDFFGVAELCLPAGAGAQLGLVAEEVVARKEQDVVAVYENLLDGVKLRDGVGLRAVPARYEMQGIVGAVEDIVVRRGIVAFDMASVVGLVYLRYDSLLVEEGQGVAALRDGVVAPGVEFRRAGNCVCLRGQLAVVRLVEEGVLGACLVPDARTVDVQDFGPGG